EEAEGRQVAAKDLRARDDVAHFGLDDIAGVAGRLANRIGAHTVRAAEGELLRRGEVLRGKLAGDREQEAGVFGHALLPAEVVVPLVEVALRIARIGAGRRRRGADVAPGEGQAVSVQAAAEVAVSEVADEGALVGVNVLLR